MILITGATGLVGGHLIRRLLQTTDKVVALRRVQADTAVLETIFRFYGDNPTYYLSKIEWRTGDILDPDSLKNAFSGITEVYHCAAVVGFGMGSAVVRPNVQGTRNMVNAALTAKIKKFCFVSSIASLGRPEAETGVVTEGCRWNDKPDASFYSQSKYLSEMEVMRGIEMGLPAVIVNPGIILGVSGKRSGSSELFYRTKRGLWFYTHGGSGYVDVRDVALCMTTLMDQECFGERFILVSENVDNKRLLELIANGYGNRKPFILLGDKFLQAMGAVVEFSARLAGREAPFSRSYARVLTHFQRYSNEKIINRIGVIFIPIEKTIEDICGSTKEM